jgi:hypothetical protein
MLIFQQSRAMILYQMLFHNGCCLVMSDSPPMPVMAAPSISTLLPLMAAAWSLARNRIAFATSSTVARWGNACAQVSVFQSHRAHAFVGDGLL